MPTAEGRPQTLYDKVFQDHIVDERLDGTILLYIGKLRDIPDIPVLPKLWHTTYPNDLNQTDIWCMKSPHLYVSCPQLASTALPNLSNSKLLKA